MHRRRFLALSGAAITGIWVHGTGLIRLDRRMVIELSGRCSFCGKTAEELFGLAGVLGRRDRICNECVEICLEILRDDLIQVGMEAPPDSLQRRISEELDASSDFSVTEVLRHGAQPRSKAELERTLKELREMLSREEPIHRPESRHDELACTFCDQGQSAVAKLIAGPTVYICDGCVGEAATLLIMHA